MTIDPADDRESSTAFERVMHWQVSFRPKPEFLLVAVTGTPTAKEMLQVVDQIAARMDSVPTSRILIDLREVRTVFGFTEQLVMGTRVSELLQDAKVASVVPVDRRTGVSQKAAQHQGGRLQVFTEEAAAVDWLRSPEG